MSLMQRVERAQQAAQANGTEVVPVSPPPPELVLAPSAPRSPAREELLREVRLRLQAETVSAFSQLLDIPQAEVRTRIQGIVDGVIARHSFAVTREERQRLIEEMVHDVTGFGPLEPLLSDESITEVMVNGPSHIYIERGGRIQRIDSTFLNDEHVLRVIDRIIAPMGRRIDESSPRVDARLPDGSRVNAII
jgi:pilus assembly protein CpaF